MKTFTSAWELARDNVGLVRVDSSVLDQLLRGCPEIRWEIQSLQDHDIAVEALDPRASGEADDLAALRYVLCDEAQVVVRPVGELSAAAPAALWSVAGSPTDRQRLAQLVNAHLYEPQILIHPISGDLTARRALKLAARIGAISPLRKVPLADGSARLVGLHEAGSAA